MNRNLLDQKIKHWQKTMFELLEEIKENTTDPALNKSDFRQGINLEDEVREYEIKLIERALEIAGGSQRRAAKLLSVKVTTLNAKLKRYSINPKKQFTYN
jgi:DNA-binding NtrC family response regulator